MYTQVIIGHLTLLAIALLADWIVGKQSLPILRALCDNLGHAAIGSLTWLCVRLCNPKLRPACVTSLPCTSQVLVLDAFRVYGMDTHVFGEMVIAGICSSCLDLDHFVAARTITLYGATHLTSRPFGHALMFIPFAVRRVNLMQLKDVSNLLTLSCFHASPVGALGGTLGSFTEFVLVGGRCSPHPPAPRRDTTRALVLACKIVRTCSRACVLVVLARDPLCDWMSRS